MAFTHLAVDGPVGVRLLKPVEKVPVVGRNRIHQQYLAHLVWLHLEVFDGTIRQFVTS